MEESKIESGILTTRISNPTEFDVIVRDKGIANARLEAIVGEHLAEYQTCDRFGKAVVAANVLNEFKQKGGRFLRPSGDTFDTVGESKARKLISVLLRQKAKGEPCLVKPIPFGEGGRRAVSRLLTDCPLIGREQEHQALLDSLDSLPRPDSHPTVTLILGESGIGKTMLAESIKPDVESRNGLFLTASFGRTSGSGEIVAVLSSMMTSFVINSRERHLKDLLEHEFNKDETMLLLDACPALYQLLTENSLETHSTNKPNAASVKMVLSLVMRFLQAIASSARPMVLLFENVHCANADTVDLLCLALSSLRSHHVMIIATCTTVADNEALSTKFLRGFREGSVSSIRLTGLSGKDVGSMVEHILQCDREDAESLGRVIHFLSKGHTRLVSELLKLLEEDELLLYDYDARKWTYDEHLIRNIVDENFVKSLTSRRIDRLSETTKSILACASCIGFVFEEHLVRLLCASENLGINEAIEHGFLVNDVAPGFYRFKNEEALCAAYSIIPSNATEEVHEGLGRTLLRVLNDDDTEANLFVIVNQFIRCKLKRQRDRVSLAELCLKAGQKAARASLFQTARDYTVLGINQLEENGWKDQYSLVLQLHNAAAEICYCTGDYERHHRTVSDVYKYARVYEDTLNARVTEINVVASQGKMKDSIDLGVETLVQLGLSIPRNPSSFDKARALFKTRRRLSKKSLESLQRLPPMIDSGHLVCMQVMNTILLSVFHACPNLLPCLVAAMIELTLRSGLSPMSGVGFAYYGMILSSIKDRDVLEAYKYGKLGLDLLDVCGSKEAWLARVSAVFYGLTCTWSVSYKTVQEPLRLGYQSGLLCGDVEYAMLNGSIYCWICSLTMKLPELESELRTLSEQMLYYGQLSALSAVQMTWQYCLNMMGQHDGDVLRFDGEAMKEAELLRVARASNPAVGLWLKLNKTQVAVVLGKWNEAAIDCDGLESLLGNGYGGMAESQVMFFLCITGLKRPNKKRLSVVKKMQKRLQKFAQFAPHNMLGLSWLVDAEMARFKRQPRAKNLYVSAMTQLHDDGFGIVEAFASELYAEYLNTMNEPALSQHFFRKARDAYESVGASAKVDQMLSLA